MNPYEITFIVRPDLDDDQTRAAIDQVTGRLTNAGGEILATVPWNPPRRRMAYPIRDFGDGFYVTCVFRIESQALPGIENALKLNDNILRHLLLQATQTNIQQAVQRAQQAAAPRPATPETPAAEPEAATVQTEAVAAQPEPLPVEEEPALEPVGVAAEPAVTPPPATEAQPAETPEEQ